MAQIPFQDNRLDWNSLCNKGWYPGCLPVLEVDGAIIGMDPSIAEYVGKMTGFYPADPKGAEAFELVFQILTFVSDTLTNVKERDPQRKIQVRQQLVSPSGPVSQALVHLEQMLQSNASGFLVGNSFTIADLASWRACGWVSSGILDGVATDYVAKAFPSLMQHHYKIDRMPEVQNWMDAHASNYKR